LRAWRDRRAAERVDIRNIRDELALSARGRPIGIRVTFEAVFPEDGDYRVAPSALGTIDRNLPLALQFLRSVQSTIEPHSGKGESMPARAASYVTSRPYDVEAMYQTIVAEGNKRCTQSRP
jgi:hypothetical protein